MLKHIKYLAILLLAVASFTACDKDELNINDPDQGGVPVVRYIRPCDVDVSDSLLSSAYLGNRIAIIGENLAGVTSIYFNDIKAKLNPNFVTNNSIIVTIPSDIPGVKQDLIKLYTKNDSSYYTFETKVPAPSITSMTCEYVADGDIANIQGNYFINDVSSPLTVTFTGGLVGEIISFDLTNIAVRVPSGAKPGPITVSSVYGKEESSLWFRDNRNIILNFNNGNYPDYDYYFGWHGGKGVATTDGVNGNYLKFSGAVDAGGGTADADFCYDRWTYTPEDPDFVDATALDKYVLKFEVNVKEVWSSAAMQFIFTGVNEVWINWQNNAAWPAYASTHGGNENWKRSESYPRLLWKPWETVSDYTTDGWITVSLPMSDAKYNYIGSAIQANGKGHYSGLTIWVGAGFDPSSSKTACNPTMWIDNVRIVQK